MRGSSGEIQTAASLKRAAPDYRNGSDWEAEQRLR